MKVVAATLLTAVLSVPAVPVVSLVSPAAPAAITIATSRGAAEIAVRTDREYPVLASIQLERLLPISKTVGGGWAEVSFADQPFRFLLDAPVVMAVGRLLPLAGGAYVNRDTLFLPLQWLTEHIPRMFGEGYRYDPVAARFEEARLQPVVASTAPGSEAVPRPRMRAPSDLARRNGFRMQHRVTIDAGHGGRDSGNPGHYLPDGVQEKHVALGVALHVQRELERRGIEVIMTRTRDAFVALGDRTGMCVDDCDLFVSIHVNSMPRRAGYTAINGVTTYSLGDAVTQEAERVAHMENEALKYESDASESWDDPIIFILKDLHTNEYLRESAQLADAIQRNAARRHPGTDRGVAQSNSLYVLRTARRPAVLVETGFATNRRDAQYLASPAGQAELGKAIAEGIATYLLQYESKVLGSKPAL